MVLMKANQFRIDSNVIPKQYYRHHGQPYIILYCGPSPKVNGGNQDKSAVTILQFWMLYFYMDLWFVWVNFVFVYVCLLYLYFVLIVLEAIS